MSENKAENNTGNIGDIAVILPIEDFLRFSIDKLESWKKEEGIDLSEQKMYVARSVEKTYYNMGRLQGLKEALNNIEANRQLDEGKLVGHVRECYRPHPLGQE